MGQNIVLDEKTWTNFTKCLKAAMHLEFKQIQNEFKYLRHLFGKREYNVLLKISRIWLHFWGIQQKNIKNLLTNNFS